MAGRLKVSAGRRLPWTLPSGPACDWAGEMLQAPAQVGEAGPAHLPHAAIRYLLCSDRRHRKEDFLRAELLEGCPDRPGPESSPQSYMGKSRPHCRAQHGYPHGQMFEGGVIYDSLTWTNLNSPRDSKRPGPAPVQIQLS